MIFAHKSQGKALPGFTPVCEIVADLSNMAGALKKRRGNRGNYWIANFEVGILFGGTELVAKLFWKDSDVRVITSALDNEAHLFNRAMNVRVTPQSSQKNIISLFTTNTINVTDSDVLHAIWFTS